VIGTDLRSILGRRPLGARSVRRIFDRLVAPGTEETDRVEILAALAARPPTVDELVHFAREMRRHARPFPVSPRDGAIDLCGSGGARVPSFNVSTVAAFVVRAAGMRVVKHGNRSRRICGSSDLLEALGLPVTTSRPFARATYRRLGIAFLHAPLYHPETAAVATARQRLGIPTVFNRLGPLSNPARLVRQVSGAADPAGAWETARALRALGVRAGVTMSSDDGCDEFSPSRPTTVVRWSARNVRRSRVRPADHLPPDDRRGDWSALPPPAARDEAERILAGGGGARRGSVLLTAGAALLVGGRVRTLDAGVRTAEVALDRGDAQDLLERLREVAVPYRRDRGG